MPEDKPLIINEGTFELSFDAPPPGVTHTLSKEGLFPVEEVTKEQKKAAKKDKKSVIVEDDFEDFLSTFKGHNNKAYFSKYFNGKSSGVYNEVIPFIDPATFGAPSYNHLGNQNHWKMNRCFTENTLFPHKSMIKGGSWNSESGYIRCSKKSSKSKIPASTVGIPPALDHDDIIFRVTLKFSGNLDTQQRSGTISLLLTCESVKHDTPAAADLKAAVATTQVDYLAVKEVKIDLLQVENGTLLSTVFPVVVYDNIYVDLTSLLADSGDAPVKGGGKRRKCTSMKKKRSCSRRKKCSWTKKSRRSRGHCRKSKNRRSRKSNRRSRRR